MNGYIMLIIVLITGLLSLLYGIYNLIKFKSVKEIGSLDLNQNQIELYKGKYTITVIGALHLKKLPFRIKSHAGNKIDIYENILKYRYFKAGKFRLDYAYFSIEGNGIYDFDFYLEDVAFPVIKAERNPDHLSFIIKQYSSSIRFIAGLILIILGLHITLFSIGWILHY